MTDASPVITGLGIVSAAGIGTEPFWSSLCSCRNGFRPISLFDAAPYSVQHAGEIPAFDPASFLGKKGLRDLDRATRILMVASLLAIEDSGLRASDENRQRIGVSVGTTFGSLRSFAEFDRTGLQDGPRYVNPSLFPNTVINSPASRVAIRFGLKGFNTTLATGFCAGLDAASAATDFLRLGRAEAVCACATEELCEESFRILVSQGLLAEDNGASPESVPFLERRRGAVLAEAAASAIIETADSASARGAVPYAKLRGQGASFDPAQDWSFGSHAGLAQAIREALGNASFSPDDIDCVVSGANSSEGIDRIEAAALRDVFGPRLARIPVTSAKAAAGETYSCSGMLSLAAAALCLRHSLIPPLPAGNAAEDASGLLLVTGMPLPGDYRTALVTSADPYGSNAAIVLERCDA
ncbi:MAG: beta-ketoacyl-ACP synthase II [Thermodesulfovibrionales bacterium]